MIKNDDFENNDKAKIELIRKKYDLNKLSDVEMIYNQLNTGELRFNTPLGNRFDDEICEIYEKLKAGKPKKEKAPKTQAFEEMNPSMQKAVKKELVKQAKKRRRIIFILIFFALLSFGYFLYINISMEKSEQKLTNLTKLLDSDALKGNNENITVKARLDDKSIVEKTVLDKYASIYNSNKRLIGWLKIADTNIDYPVMQCDDNSFYLTHNFDSSEDKAGALFLDCNNNVLEDNDNYIIYGHHLTSGKMFSSLGEYESISYYKKHPEIVFDTIYEEQTFAVMYAFRSKVYKEDDVVFKYYEFINANSEEEFNSYMNEMKENSFYDTGVEASYGDTLLTLSTCDYHQENGRFVVVAKKIR